MGFFGLFGKKEKHLTEKELKWNRMWELWADGKIETPYAELMTYQSEVNNGGHAQYFDNVENIGDLQKEISALEQILPQVLKDNLLKAYNAFSASEENSDEILQKCDKVFSENEEEIIRLLEEYSERTEL